MKCVIVLCCLVQLLYGPRIGSAFLPVLLTAEDVHAWPYSVGILVKWVTFLGTLHRPAAGADLAVGGVSPVEMLLV